MQNINCECFDWERAEFEDTLLFLRHHPKCKHAKTIPEIRELLDNLIKGIESWAADEDGVHPDCWSAYVEACMVTLRKINFEEA